jgi:hypothetical protein
MSLKGPKAPSSGSYPIKKGRTEWSAPSFFRDELEFSASTNLCRWIEGANGYDLHRASGPSVCREIGIITHLLSDERLGDL